MAGETTMALTPRSAGVSVVVLTLNEEVNIARCLDALRWSDDIVVVDSGSTDRTVEIARSYGARVVERRLVSWSEHQNWINEHVPFRHPWVYYSDADEVMPEDLRDEIVRVVASDAPHVAYRVRYKNYLMGRWLKHSGGYPIWVLRLFRPDKVRWERLVNPVPVVDGSEGRLQGHFLHYSFNKGFDAWFAKHNAYSRDEAREGMRVRTSGSLSLPALLSTDRVQRRQALKALSFRLPGRGFLRFLYHYVIGFGFLDGRAGFHWAVLMGLYEYMIEMKMIEIQRRERGDAL